MTNQTKTASTSQPHQQRTKRKTSWKIGSFLERNDLFGEPLPAFNIKGETTVNTVTGGILSVILVVILLAYGGLKFLHLYDKHNPQISEVTEKGVLDSSEIMNLNQEGFRFAFTIEGYLDKERKDDPAYVKSLVRLRGLKDGEKINKLLPYHECKESDWEEFAPTTKSASSLFTSIKNDPKRGFYCLDWDDENPLEIYGTENDLNFQRIEVLLVPCNYVHLKQTEGATMSDSVHKDCVADQTAQEEYLGSLKVIIYHTSEHFYP